MDRDNSLIPKHGGYRNLKSFKIARLIFDVTVRFCNRYIDKKSRTHDQMVQAARSGVQNIAEGSEVSGTSKKMELKLTQVARASLEELKLDYEDFLRQNNLPVLEPSHPVLKRFRKKRCKTLEEVRQWVAEEYELEKEKHGLTRTDTDKTSSVPVRVSPCPPKTEKPIPPRALVANGTLSLLNLGNYFLDRQIQRLAKDFQEKGGFTERLYQTRKKQKS